MPRIRSVKPEFWHSEDMTTVSRDCRLFYIGLWNLADEHSRLRGDSRFLKGQIFPYDDDVSQDVISKWVDELEALGNVRKYRVGSATYLFLPKLAQHQRLEPQKTPSKLPAPPWENGSVPAEAQVSGPPTLFSDPTVMQSGNGADFSGNGADKSALLYGTGSMEHGTGSMEHVSARGALTQNVSPTGPGTDTKIRTPFDAFYAIYPRKVARDAARRAWDKATKRASPSEIIAGAVRYRDDPRRQARDIEYTAHPATWLNAGRWADEAGPTPGSDLAVRGPAPPRGFDAKAQRFAEMARELNKGAPT